MNVTMSCYRVIVVLQVATESAGSIQAPWETQHYCAKMRLQMRGLGKGISRTFPWRREALWRTSLYRHLVCDGAFPDHTWLVTVVRLRNTDRTFATKSNTQNKVTWARLWAWLYCMKLWILVEKLWKRLWKVKCHFHEYFQMPMKPFIAIPRINIVQVAFFFSMMIL